MERYSKMKISNKEQALKWVLDYCQIPKHAFSIGEPAEQSVCLEKNGRMHTVYMVERGKRFEESQHESEREAHLKMIYHLAPSKADYTEMCNLYERRILVQQAKKGGAFVGAHSNHSYSPPGLVAASKLSKAGAAISVGDTVRIRTKIKRGSRDHIQVIEGLVVGKKYAGQNQTITIRRVFQGVVREKDFVVGSPEIASIETIVNEKNRRIRHCKEVGKVSKPVAVKKKM